MKNVSLYVYMCVWYAYLWCICIYIYLWQQLGVGISILYYVLFANLERSYYKLFVTYIYGPEATDILLAPHGIICEMFIDKGLKNSIFRTGIQDLSLPSKRGVLQLREVYQTTKTR